MARIPVFASNNQASNEAPAVMKRDERVGVMADTDLVDNSAGSFAGKQITELGEKMIKVENANDLSKAEIQTKTEMLALEEEITKNPESFKDYDSRMQKIGDSATKLFRNQEAKEEFKQKFGLTNLIFKNKMQGEVYKKEVDAGRATTLKQMDLESSGYINAENDEEKLAARQKIEETMNKAVSLQLFTQEDGLKEVERTIKSADEAIKDNKALARRKEKELSLAAKEAVNARENEFIKMKVNGVDKLGTPITREELVKMARQDMNAGDINPKFAEIYINALKSPKAVGAISDNKTFNRIALDILDPSKKAEEILIDLTNRNAIGEISDEDFGILHTFYDTATKENIEKFMPKKNLLQRLFNTGEDKNLRQEIVTNMFKQYMKRVNSGEDPAVAASEVISLGLDTHLSEQLKNPNRQYVVNKETKQRAYSDDSGATWYDAKTGELLK